MHACVKIEFLHNGYVVSDSYDDTRGVYYNNAADAINAAKKRLVLAVTRSTSVVGSVLSDEAVLERAKEIGVISGDDSA